ncbi:mechanosensitive ion channel domain-containing protein, partial [Planctomycetota bacterium]
VARSDCAPDFLLAQKKSAVEAVSTDEATKAAVANLYEKALTQFRLYVELQSRTQSWLDRQKTLPEQLSAERQAPLHPNDVSVVTVADVGVEQAEQALAVAQQTLKDARQRVVEGEAEAKRRGERLANMPAETKEAQNQLLALQEPLVSPTVTDQVPVLVEARRLLRQCQIKALTQRLEHNRIERQYYETSDELLVAQRTQASRQVVQAEDQVQTWQKHIDQLRQQKATAERRAAERTAEAAQSAHPAIKQLAEQNSQLTKDEENLVRKVSDTVTEAQTAQTEVNATREEWTHLRDTVEKAGGVTQVMGTFLISKRSSLPLVNTRRRQIRDRVLDISQAQVEWMTADQEWIQLARLDVRTDAIMAELMPGVSAEERRVLVDEALPLLQKRRQILERTRKLYLDYSAALAELDAQERDLVATLEEYADFLDTYVLWARNLSPLRPTQLQLAWEGVRWLGDGSRWRGLAVSLGRSAQTRPSAILLAVLLCVLLMLIRRWAHLGIVNIAKRIETSRVGRLMDTVWVLVLTALLPWVWVGCVWLARYRLGTLAEDREFVEAVRGGLQGWMWLLLWVGSVRAICLPRGLADIHLRLRGEALHYLRRHFFFCGWLLSPLVFLWGAMQYHSDPRFVNSLGAISFTLAMLLFMGSAARVLRLQGPVLIVVLKRYPDAWFARLRYAWYLGTIGIFFTIALLTVLGYLYAAQQLFEKVAVTLLVLAIAFFLRALFKRWLWVARFNLARLEDQRRQEMKCETEALTEGGADSNKAALRTEEPPQATIYEFSEQAHRVMNSIVAVLLAIVLWQVWNELLPAMEAIQNKPLWESTNAQAEDIVITVGSLIQAMLIALVTLVTARNVPGLLEMLVLGRLPIDRGLRFAIVTLCRYALVVTGMVLAFNQIGVGWSKVQWLVAAMTVGLGFGLQEIFANFISGLIILVERPVRVDDVVTVGEVTGRVTSIKTRATTIRRWDERELIVPNKEFVTGQLVNWTLTDTVMRKEFVVGIAYGSDIAKAEKTLYAVAHANPLVLKEPPPLVIFQGFGSSSLDFELRVYLTGMDQYVQAWHQINCAIDTAFRAAGIEIAFPQQDLHLRSIDPSAVQMLEKK